MRATAIRVMQTFEATSVCMGGLDARCWMFASHMFHSPVGNSDIPRLFSHLTPVLPFTPGIEPGTVMFCFSYVKVLLLSRLGDSYWHAYTFAMSGKEAIAELTVTFMGLGTM